MEELRLLDRWWHARYSARRLSEFVALYRGRGGAVTPQRLAVIRAPLASATPRRRAVLPFENSECDLRAEGIFALVKRRTPQSPDHYLSPSHSQLESRAAEPKKNNQQSARVLLVCQSLSACRRDAPSPNAPRQDASIAPPCDR
jgi:hypothetical protein